MQSNLYSQKTTLGVSHIHIPGLVQPAEWDAKDVTPAPPGMGWFEIPGMGGLVWNGNWDLAYGNQANYKIQGRGIVVIPGTSISVIWVNYGMLFLNRFKNY